MTFIQSAPEAYPEAVQVFLVLDYLFF